VAERERVVIAVVLAGGGPDAVSAMRRDAPNKAFVKIGGQALVARTIASLRSSPYIRRIVAVAPPAMHASDALAGADECRPDGTRMIDSLAAGLAGAPVDELVLIAASDLPVLSRAAIEEFVDRARERDLDIAYSIVDSRVNHAQYPRGVRHTWATMFEGHFCGGGLVALKPRVLTSLRMVLDDLGAARKSPFRLASLFGWDLLPRFAFGSLRIADAEARASTILRAPVGAIPCSHADIAVNVDRPADIAIANGLLR
jgi:GTP:adenosylcobinamide-phosphate guanylyltransferase